MTPCPNCHGTEYTLQDAGSDKPVSFLRRLFGGGRPKPGSSALRRCSFCGTLYSSSEDAVDDDDDEQRLDERRARMEERMSGFRDSTLTSSMFPEGAQDSLPPDQSPVAPLGKTPPTPYRAPTLEELSKAAVGIEMQKPEGLKCRKCGHFAYMVRTPETRCAKCSRVFDKMDEEAEAERQEMIRKAEKSGKGRV